MEATFFFFANPIKQKARRAIEFEQKVKSDNERFNVSSTYTVRKFIYITATTIVERTLSCDTTRK